MVIGWDKEKIIYYWLPTWTNQPFLGEKLILFIVTSIKNVSQWCEPKLKTAFLQPLLPFQTQFLHFWFHQPCLEGHGKWDLSITVLPCFFPCSSMGCNSFGEIKTSMGFPWASATARNIHPLQHRVHYRLQCKYLLYYAISMGFWATSVLLPGEIPSHYFFGLGAHIVIFHFFPYSSLLTLHFALKYVFLEKPTMSQLDLAGCSTG